MPKETVSHSSRPRRRASGCVNQRGSRMRGNDAIGTDQSQWRTPPAKDRPVSPRENQRPQRITTACAADRYRTVIGCRQERGHGA